MLSGSQLIYKALLRNNTKNVFIYSGGAIMPLIDQFKNKYYSKINYYINNHEQNCGHSATGYAKTTERTGVCIVTSGPGLTNMVTPILDAQNDSTPLIVLSGQVSTSALGTRAFQECNAVKITEPCTKWSYQIKETDDITEIINKAFYIANHKRKGVVHIDLPKDLLTKKYVVDKSSKFMNINMNMNIDMISNESNKQINYHQIIDIINNSKKPILYVGQGCNSSYKELTYFVNKTKIPITTTIHANGCVNENNPYSLGFLGMHGHPRANLAIHNSDCIIALGSRFDDRTIGTIDSYAPNCKNIIHVNIDNDDLGKNIKNISGRTLHKYEISCKNFLQTINSKKYINNIHINTNKWIRQIRKYPKIELIKHKLTTQYIIRQINHILHHSKIFKTTDRNMDYIITTGVGNHQMMASQFIKWTNPKSFISSGSLGVMGVGLPYAIGAQIANPNKRIILIDGDGSFNHTLADLQTIKRYNLPIKIFIMNDSNLSMVRAWEQLFFDNNIVATDLPTNPDYCKLGESYGITNILCDNEKDIHMSIIDTLDYDGPIICEFRLKSTLCLPLVEPGKGLNEMILSYKQVHHLEGDAPS